MAEGEVVHVVKSGETLGAIALKYKTSVKAVMEKNSIKDARKLRVGQKLVIVSRKPVAQKQEETTAQVEKPVAPAQPVEKEKVAEPVKVAPDAPAQNTNPPVIEL